MPIKKSAKKALKRSELLRERNLGFKISMKNCIKGIRKSVLDMKKKGELDTAKLDEMIINSYKAIDKAAKVKVIHKKCAARKKSRITKLVNNLKTQQS